MERVGWGGCGVEKGEVGWGVGGGESRGSSENGKGFSPLSAFKLL